MPSTNLCDALAEFNTPSQVIRQWNKIVKVGLVTGLSEQRALRTAPVDLLGCEKYPEDLEPVDQRFHCLVSLLLSSQTRDAANAACMGRLRELGLSPQLLVDMKEAHLAEVLKGVSFHTTKAKYLQQTCHIILNDYAGDIPATFKELTRLPGIGPKMAHLVLSVAWGRNEGIAVDTHVHRVANRLGWVSTKTPLQTERHLEKLFPESLFLEVNTVLVGFGQEICRPIGPRVSQLPLPHSVQIAW
ncbi:MAG: uncharacterized protein KVP18_003183 [Porospora cf. gigantea A]|uniref:uncharacterized protein n=1 Tax=Porospora cf. gigantea A TaxID=2853593 RepID=UPI00355A7347|nr:MAG: hypothetical protein KVP18_003183 [Porospora cf. gigantea A]